MELSARKKQRERSQKTSPKKDAHQNSDGFTRPLSIRCNTILYNSLQNALEGMHTGGDYQYTSVADLIRKALSEYANGMKLTAIVEKGEKRSTTIRVSEDMHAFYKSLPSRMRSQILERAIRTFIKEKM